MQTAATAGLQSSQDFREVINVLGKTRACYNRNVSLEYVLLDPDVIQQTFLALDWLSNEDDGLLRYQTAPARCLSSTAFTSLPLLLQSGAKFPFLLHKTPSCALSEASTAPQNTHFHPSLIPPSSLSPSLPVTRRVRTFVLSLRMLTVTFLADWKYSGLPWNKTKGVRWGWLPG